MTKHPGKGHDVSAAENPLLSESVSVTVNACGLNASGFIVGVQHGVARAFDQGLTVHIGEEKVAVGLSISVLQEFSQDSTHGGVQRNQKRLAAFCDAHVEDLMLQLYITDDEVHQAVLPDTCGKEQI